MRTKKVLSVLLTGAILAGVLSGCGNSNTGGQGQAADAPTQTQETAGESNSSAEDGIVDLEVWTTNTGFLPVEKDSVTYNFYKDLLGVGIVQPYVEWNGGQTYSEQLNLKIVAGEMPDIVQFVNGMETGLAKEGALLGLKMPVTQEEFVDVLRAFKTQDPNGNGQADEIPTGGRAEARWMDYLFSMYGIAMWEGFPQWDIYDGELTYAAVTPNMRDALEFISGLYQEGLLDAETLMNDKAGWDGKVNSDQVGVFFQWAEQSYMYATNIYNATGTKADWSILPVISADGYEGFYTKKPTMGAQYGVKNMDDAERIEAAMKVLDAYGNKELRDTLDLGPEGMTSSRGEDGTLKKLPDDKTTQENMVVKPSDCMANVDSVIHLLELTGTEEDKWAVDKAIQNVKDVQQYGRLIAGDGIPSSIYDGYDDIENRTLYVEYASKIIAGEWPIEKFDEFVEKWYASGGEEVTNAARDWYAAKNK